MTLTRRNFANGCGVSTSSALIRASHGIGDPAPFSTRLPIPQLIDAAKQGNAVNLRVISGRHAFVHGKPTRTYGYSAPVLGPVIRQTPNTSCGHAGAASRFHVRDRDEKREQVRRWLNFSSQPIS
jgi:hypothetical protein